jgi:hypothetical protein
MREQIPRLVRSPSLSLVLARPQADHLPRLQEKIIDIEVLAHTPSPTIDPSVHTILIGHSMGGIVAADTLLAITNDHPIPHSSPSSSSTDNKPEPSTFLFPYIAGVLAFDTPYLGISPGVVAHSAETHITTAQTAITQLSGLSGMFWGGSAAAAGTKAQEDREREEKKKKGQLALPAPESASAPGWQKWGKVAMFAGAAGVVAAGSAAAYIKRQQISEGFGWATSHLEFVGCLMRAEELRKRVESVVAVNRGLGVGWANFYTRLGSRALDKEGGLVGKALGNERTFCNLPKSEVGAYWRQCVNDNATDETMAHMSEFCPVYSLRGGSGVVGCVD